MYHRARQFYDIIASEPGLTELEIVRRAGLKKTPYSRRILLDLIAEGYVARASHPSAERLTYVFYIQETARAL